MLKISFPSRLARPLCALAGLLIAGCATGDIEMLATISGGKEVRIPLGRQGIVMTAEDGVQVTVATFMLTPDKKPVHLFAFSDARKRALRSVRVEDVSDSAAIVLVDDAAPKLTEAGAWRYETEPIELVDPRLGWMATISNTLRVYRFKLTFADGRTLELLQGALYPAQVKSGIRQVFGQKY